VRRKLSAAPSPAHRAAIRGATDSEQFFWFFLSTYRAARVLLDFLRDAARVVWTRLGRTLYHLERDGIYDCEICGFPQVHHDPPPELPSGRGVRADYSPAVGRSARSLVLLLKVTRLGSKTALQAVQPHASPLGTVESIVLQISA
jgi:hypothetical protein